MITTVIADHQQLCRDGLKYILEKENDFQVVRLASTASEVLDYFNNSTAGLLILELQMPGKNGIEILKQLRASNNEIKVLILNSGDSLYYLSSCLENGANGFINKTSTAAELMEAARKAAGGEKYVDQKIAAGMVRSLYNSLNDPAKLETTLTRREHEVLNLIAEGLTNQEIAEKLFMSRRTVESHRKNMITKTGVKNTASLIRYAMNEGILS